MKSKQFLLLVVVAAVLGGGALAVLKGRRSDFEQGAQQLGGQLLPNFDVNAVTGLRFTQGSNTVVIAKVNDVWTVRERSNYPANFGEVAEFVRKLSDLKIAVPVKVGASRLPMLELTKDAGTLVELLDKDNKAIQTLTLGKKHTRGNSDDSPMGGGGFPDGRYVQVGSSSESVALITDPLSGANPKPEEWLAKDFLKVEQPILIEVLHPEATNNFTLTRTNEFGDWHLKDADAGQELDKSKLFSFNTVLSGASFSDVSDHPDVAKMGLDHPVEARIQTAAGFTYKLKLGKMEGDLYALQVATDAVLARERTPGKDEKSEEKDKLDKEFKDKLAKQEEKLKTEQSFGKWTYTVTKWSVDALLKKRSELLMEKKPATSSGAATAPSTSAAIENPLDLDSLKPPAQ